MYISKLTINLHNEQVQKDLVAPYELHRTLGKAFPQARSKKYRSECGVLFRVEPPQRNDSGPIVLVQSESAAEWERLPPGYALKVAETTLDHEELKVALRPGRRFRFRLVANPTVRKSPPDRKHGRRVPLIHPGSNDAGHPTYFEWLLRQAGRHGFALPVREVDDGRHVEGLQDAPFYVTSRRRNRNKGLEGERQEIEKQALPLFGVRFDGVLRVEESDKLVRAVRQGIGPAKAFGFGLLSLAPL